MLFRCIAASTAVFFSTVIPIGSANAAPPAIAFAEMPLLTDASISPNGRYFFARVTHGAESTFTVFDLNAGGAVVYSLGESEKGVVEWAQWANDDTILLRLGILSGNQVTLRVEGEAEKYYTKSASEVFVLEMPGSEEEPKPVWRITKQGSLQNVLYDDPDHILVQESWRSGRPDVYKKSVRDEKAKAEMVQRGKPEIYDWWSDRTGAVRVGVGGDYAMSGKIRRKLLMRAAGEEDFKDLADVLYHRLNTRFVPLEFAEDLNQLYVASNHETDTMALYLFDFVEERFIKRIYHNPDYDVTRVSIDDRNGKLISVHFGDDGSGVKWFDEALNDELNKIAANFPGKQVLLSTYSFGADAGIVKVSSPRLAGQLYIYDRKAKSLSPLPPQHADLPEQEMGRVFTASYQARDGETIPAFITLPPEVETLEEAKGLPFVIYPHGGPAARDFLTFDYVAQFFATRGYGVLQMNFRGSTGYGLKYEQAGRKQWGRLMQDDVTDGVIWLTENGYADAERVAIYGASYGGYTALMGAVLTPELYQCAVSFAGVTNLPDLVAGSSKKSYIARLVGDRFDEGDTLREYSPIFRADDFAIPVMLLHGRLDYTVPYDHSEGLERKLKDAGKEVEFVALPKSGHGLSDYEDSVRFFEALDEYLSTCLPV